MNNLQDFYFKKRLGQHFLIDQNIQKKIISSFVFSENECLLEIGPGFGALTQHLWLKNKNLKVIELDKRIVSYLNQKFSGLCVIWSDVLKVNFDEIFLQKKFRIISNLPYNIGSKVIFKFLEAQFCQEALFMVQKEVGERFVAKCCSKKYNNLTVLLNAFCFVKLLFLVSKNSFKPRPKVDSAVIKITKRNNFKFEHFRKFQFLLKLVFAQKQKTILNNLKQQFEPYKLIQMLHKIKVDPKQRPYHLSLEKYQLLFENLCNEKLL